MGVLQSGDRGTAGCARCQAWVPQKRKPQGRGSGQSRVPRAPQRVQGHRGAGTKSAQGPSLWGTRTQVHHKPALCWAWGPAARLSYEGAWADHSYSAELLKTKQIRLGIILRVCVCGGEQGAPGNPLPSLLPFHREPEPRCLSPTSNTPRKPETLCRTQDGTGGWKSAGLYCRKPGPGRVPLAWGARQQAVCSLL